MPAFGAATNLVLGTITLTPAAGVKYWYVQNQDVAPLKITFPADSGFSTIVLNAATALGAAGDWMDGGDRNEFPSVGFPYLGPITLTSTVDTAQFGAGSRA